MKKTKRAMCNVWLKYFGILIITIALNTPVFAQQITEIMYDPEGSDTDREWIEICNDTITAIDLTTYKFFEANVNHGIDSISGGNNVGAGECVVLVQDLAKFKSDFQNYSGKVFKSSFSLSNSGELLSLKKNDAILYTINYSNFIQSDKSGQTLQAQGSLYQYLPPSPGVKASETTATNNNSTSTATTTQNISTTTQSSSTITQETVFNPVYYVSRPWPIQDKIYVNAGENRKVLTGMNVIFIGKALNNEKKALSGGVYSWSFGDGYTKQGEKLEHSYTNPGEYVVVLEVYSNGTLETDKIYVKAEVPDIKIKTIEKNGKKFLEVANQTNTELELSSLEIRSYSNSIEKFTFPKNFAILGKRSVLIGVELIKNITEATFVELVYPNGEKISDYGKKLTVNIVTLPVLSGATNSTATNVTVSTYEDWLKSSTSQVLGEVKGEKIKNVKVPEKNLGKIWVPQSPKYENKQIDSDMSKSTSTQIILNPSKRNNFWQTIWNYIGK